MVTTRAFVLRTVDFRESDRIVTLITPDLGKIGALARGARSSRRRFGGALEPYALLEVTLEPARGSLLSLTEAHLLQANQGLARDLRRMGAASFLLELTREITPEHQGDPRLFELLEAALSLLDAVDGGALFATVFAAALRILACAGTALCADRCNACGRPVPPSRKACFHPARGGVVCTACGGGPLVLSAAAMAGLVALDRGTMVEAGGVLLGKGEAKDLASALTEFIDHHVDRPLKTRAALADLA